MSPKHFSSIFIISAHKGVHLDVYTLLLTSCILLSGSEQKVLNLFYFLWLRSSDQRQKKQKNVTEKVQKRTHHSVVVLCKPNDK